MALKSVSLQSKGMIELGVHSTSAGALADPPMWRISVVNCHKIKVPGLS